LGIRQRGAGTAGRESAAPFEYGDRDAKPKARRKDAPTGFERGKVCPAPGAVTLTVARGVAEPEWHGADSTGRQEAGSGNPLSRQAHGITTARL
jgi:hypothetical protein